LANGSKSAGPNECAFLQVSPSRYELLDVTFCIIPLGVWLSQIAAGADWTFRASYGMQRLMAPAVVALAACLIIAHPHSTEWALPVYAGLLAWNGRSWLAFGVGLLFVALHT
jgi:hypothetical protein